MHIGRCAIGPTYRWLRLKPSAERSHDPPIVVGDGCSIGATTASSRWPASPSGRTCTRPARLHPDITMGDSDSQRGHNFRRPIGVHRGNSWSAPQRRLPAPAREPRHRAAAASCRACAAALTSRRARPHHPPSTAQSGFVREPSPSSRTSAAPSPSLAPNTPRSAQARCCAGTARTFGLPGRSGITSPLVRAMMGAAPLHGTSPCGDELHRVAAHFVAQGSYSQVVTQPA